MSDPRAVVGSRIRQGKRVTGNRLDRIGRRLKYPIASWLDKRPEWCWADLVMWAHWWGEKPLRECRRTCPAPCYCGKADARDAIPTLRWEAELDAHLPAEIASHIRDAVYGNHDPQNCAACFSGHKP